MRRSFLIVLVLSTLLLAAAGMALFIQQRAAPPPAATPEPAALAAVRRISAAALRVQLETATPPLVWDIRPVALFAEGHIPRSRVVTLDALPEAAVNVDRRQAIVIVCS